MKLNTALAGLALLLVANAALAQAVYRNVDKNGKVTFSDQPPSANAPAAPVRAGNTVSARTGLPYELQQVVQRYPVTLYTSDDCGPCVAGRALLVTRGVPFDERTVKSNEDIASLQRLSGQNGLPLLTIGTQQLKGFGDAEWSQYLDAAGYPKSAQLPAGWRNPPAQPLVALQPAAEPAPAAAAPAPAAADIPAAANGPTPSNPAGIRF
ncbi:glutaredoxin family protein [Variovorax saccharolyticus]|uniref:glutaredoxin family protein n=1 Tax=Variovorax saccharolyticus TaxID=3053516 RepID=UPI002574AAD5|nr:MULTISPECIES: glutaredoxin family protein [unclassified Variovorax]MDM0020412.1 glutaredoxin family protein [Variovorax sp. J22R187]MDM0024053.1 glutaredoxin family protein [Variovorax sp. J31P216]